MREKHISYNKNGNLQDRIIPMSCLTYKNKFSPFNQNTYIRIIHIIKFLHEMNAMLKKTVIIPLYPFSIVFLTEMNKLNHSISIRIFLHTTIKQRNNRGE
jgi:hypothetical protein